MKEVYWDGFPKLAFPPAKALYALLILQQK
jgi:hypothetical protein